MTISKAGLVAGSPQSLNNLVDQINATLPTTVSATVGEISTANGTTITSTALLANSIKTTVNAILASLKASGSMASS
jgi:hypothetical protein